MDADRWRKVRAMLDAALDLDEAARQSFLDAVGDAALRADVERLLARHAQSTRLIDRPAAVVMAETEHLAGQGWEQRQVGRRIGPFVLIELLGTGGMGAVYKAERRDGAFDQVVAIKLLLSVHPGLRDRFRREQEILAALRHPGICQLIDGGETDDGVPYLLMEYIEGTTLTDYCRAHLPEVRERLKIVREVALALAHAHRNLIVHRDIKPTNVLVERHSGRPMLLDFGIAKLIGADRPELTAQQIGPMTPAYAAPEQFLGRPISVATDVYQLGVMLYRLIAGTLPFPGEDPVALSHAVLNHNPPTLGRMHRDALQDEARRADAARHLPRALAGDLDALLRKAMARDPARRYGSMDALIADIDAVLDQRPISARQGVRFYPLRQFLRRHRLGLAIGSAAVLALIGITTFALHQARQARAEAERARVAIDFMREVFKGADPNIGRSPNAGALELVDLAAAELEVRLGAHSDLRGPLAALMASAYSSFGAMDRALPLARRAVADLEATTSQGLTLAAAYESGAWVASRNGQRALAEGWAARAEALIGTGQDAESIRIRDGVLHLKWTLAREDGKLRLAERLAEDALVNARSAPPEIRAITIGRALQRRGTIRTDLGDFAGAEEDLVEALALTEQSYGRDDYRSLRMQMALGWYYTAAGDAVRGRAMLDAVGPELMRVYGERSQTVGNYHFNLANAELALGHQAAARDGYLRAAQIYEQSGAGKTSYVGSAMWNAASIEIDLGNLAHAAALLDEIERRWDGVVPADAPVRAGFAETRRLLEARRAEAAEPAARPDGAVAR
ncbi:MAG: protein kinase [Lysobacterales bacterium]